MRTLVWFATLGLLFSACAGSPTSLTPTPTPTPTPTTTPTMTPIALSPNNNVSIPQNVSAIGCSLLPGPQAAAGYGEQIQFQWSPPNLGNAAVGYEVYAIKSDAPIPAVDALLDTTATSCTFMECNVFVVDRNLPGWEWRVRAVDAHGQLTDWSAWATFQFGPCRLSDGTPCG